MLEVRRWRVLVIDREKWRGIVRLRAVAPTEEEEEEEEEEEYIYIYMTLHVKCTQLLTNRGVLRYLSEKSL